MHIRQKCYDVVNNINFLHFYKPFVCQKLPFVKPFIYKNIPLVRTLFATGLTLIELIVALTVIGILLTIAVPAMTTFVSGNRLTTQANEFLSDLNYARSEAVKKSGNVGICVTTTGSSCAAGGNWASGWMVFADADDSESWTAGDSALRLRDALTSTTVTASSAIVVFSKSGALAAGTGAGTYTLCDSKIGQTRIVDITSAGRVTLRRGTC